MSAISGVAEHPCRRRPVPRRRPTREVSGEEGVGGVGVDVVAGDRIVDDRRFDLTVEVQAPQRGDDDVTRVDLEVAPQRLARVGAAHAVGAECGEGPVGQELLDLLDEKYSEVIELRFFEEMAIEDIAEEEAVLEMYKEALGM